MRGQAVIDEYKFGVSDRGDGQVFGDKRFKETLGLLFHGVDKVIVLAVFGIETVVGLVAP